MRGLLNVNKPSGKTSRDVVNHIQQFVRPLKVGHAGTLDPLASGVLVVCVGTATRLIEFVQQMPKQYRATFILGQRSDTEDIEGQIVVLDTPHQPTYDEVTATLPLFTGSIQQVPPKFSALSVGGRRAYQLARRNIPFELSPRQVTIHTLHLANYRYPELTLDIGCGSGTYIRSLGRDIANEMGTAAVMSSLERTSIGDFRVQDACEMNQLTSTSLSSCLLPMTNAVTMLRQVHINQLELENIQRGQSIESVQGDAEEKIAAVDSSGQLCAILVRRKDGWGPLRNLIPS